MREIIINLNDSADAKDFKVGNEGQSGNLIHHEEYKNVTNWIKKRIADMHVGGSSVVSAVTRQRLHDTITILGTRGSGKTSFLLSILNSYKDDKQVSVLNIIDPTLIEEKGHVFLSIISCIKSQVEQALEKRDANPGIDTVTTRKQWREKLKNLAHGLPSIDGVGRDLQQDAWQDPEFIMDKGIRQVTSASHLEENFDAFVTEGLGILKKECFLIPFDDIDIDFRKGWAVLETIRKYLTSPKILVLLSGDMKLFSLGIRKQQWLNFGKALLINEGELNGKMSVFNDRVTDMESQYMQKVLKPSKRVPLTTLYEKLRIQKQNLQIIIQTGTEAYNTKEEKEQNEIRKVYRNILSFLGIRNTSQSDVYSSFILSLPLRTQIQFLNEYYANVNKSELKLTDSFLSYLYEKNVPVDLALSSPRFLNQIILGLLLNEQYLEEGYQLQPTSSKASLDGTLTALSFLFSQHSTSNSFLLFDYLVKIGYVFNLFDSSQYPYEETGGRSGVSKINRDLPTVEGLVKHSGIDQDWDLKNISARIVAYSRGSINRSSKKMEPEEGIIPLNTTAHSRKQKGLELRIDQIFKDDPDIVIAYLPLSKLNYASKGGSILTYSVFQLFGTTGQLLRELDENTSSIKPKNIEDKINELLVSMSQLKTYIIPEFDRKNRSQREAITIDGEIDEGSNFPGLNISKYLGKWFQQYPAQAVSPHLLGKISKRFFTSIRKIENESKGHSLGEVFHAEIIAFMNSVLIEDVREAGEHSLGINFSNTVFSSRYFSQNLTSSIQIKEKLTLSRWLISNPLFIVFLDIKESQSFQAEPANDKSNPLQLQLASLKEDVKEEPSVNSGKQKGKKEKEKQDLYNALSIFLATEDFDRITNLSLFEKMAKIPLHDDMYQYNILGDGYINKVARKKSNIDYVSIIQSLKENNVPFELFNPDVTDWKTVKENNAQIRSNYANLVGKTTSTALRNVRLYISEEPNRRW